MTCVSLSNLPVETDIIIKCCINTSRSFFTVYLFVCLFVCLGCTMLFFKAFVCF